MSGISPLIVKPPFGDERDLGRCIRFVLGRGAARRFDRADIGQNDIKCASFKHLRSTPDDGAQWSPREIARGELRRKLTARALPTPDSGATPDALSRRRPFPRALQFRLAPAA